MTDDVDPTDDFQSNIPPESITRLLKIPSVFHSCQTDEPFDRCLVCGANLLSSNHHYVIEKIYRGSEVIIELAMCVNCQQECGEEGISEESAASLEAFLREKMDFQRRLQLMSSVNDQDGIDAWLERCLLSDRPAQMFREYQIIALCRGPWIQRDFYPALISGPSLEELADVLSTQTKDWMNDFIGSNFGMPSEFCIPPGVTPLIV